MFFILYYAYLFAFFLTILLIVYYTNLKIKIKYIFINVFPS